MNKSAGKRSVPQMQSTRDGFGRALVDLGKTNLDVIVLCADVAESTRTHWFERKYPDRFIEMGVSEQNMIGVSSGLAMEGKIPFAVAYAVFSPGRTWDQVRVSVCYSKLNVKIVGCHAGITVGPDGATHQALEDVALMRVLPYMTVIVPCDAHEAYRATIAAAQHTGPVYIRLTRDITPPITSLKTKFEIGKALLLKQGTDITVISCGPIVHEALVAVHEVEKEYGVSIQVINMSTIKPLDTEAILDAAQKTKALVTVEDHQIVGGLGSAVAEYCSQHKPILIEMVGMKDQFGESGPVQALQKKYGLDADSMKEAIVRVIKRSNRQRL